MPELIKNSIEEKATESGHITASFVLDQVSKAILSSTNFVEDKIMAAVKGATSHLGTSTSVNVVTDAGFIRAPGESSIIKTSILQISQ